MNDSGFQNTCTHMPKAPSKTNRPEHCGRGPVHECRNEIPGMGAYAYFTDPEGNTLGLWENA